MNPSYRGWWAAGPNPTIGHLLAVLVAGEALTWCERPMQLGELRPWVEADDDCEDCWMAYAEAVVVDNERRRQ